MVDISRAPPGETKRFVGRVLILLLLIAAALFAWKVGEVFLLLFGGVLLAILLDRVAGIAGHGIGLPRRWALALVLVALLAAVAAVVWLLGNQFASQFAGLSNQLPDSWATVKSQLQSIGGGQDLLNRVRSFLAGGQGGVLSSLAGTVTAFLGALADLILVVFIGLYLAVSPGLYRRGVLHLLPKNRRDRGAEVLESTGDALWKWLLGQMVSMATIGVLTTLGLWLLGVRSALALGLIAAALEFIPIVGPILAAVPAILVALAQGPTMALYVALLYLLVQQLESYVILPLVQKEAVSLPPVLSLTAVVAFGHLFGPLGILFGTPLTVVGLVAVKMLYVEDTLDDYGA